MTSRRRWTPIAHGRSPSGSTTASATATGRALIDHVRRVAAAVPGDARVVAWLHEALEHTAISEEALLAEGVSLDELRAIRLMTRDLDLRSDETYLAHVERVAQAQADRAPTSRGPSNAPTWPTGRLTPRQRRRMVATVRGRARLLHARCASPSARRTEGPTAQDGWHP